MQIEKVLTKNKSPQVAGVETSHGTILCEYFINCAGQVSELWTASSIQCVQNRNRMCSLNISSKMFYEIFRKIV